MTKLADLKRDIQPAVTITPAIAQNWLEHTVYAGQRKFRPFHAANLATDMRKGKFFPSMPIVFARMGDRKYNINGQHVLNAIVKSGQSITMSVMTVDAEDDDQIADLYSVIDVNKTRSASDSFSAHNIAGKLGLSNDMLIKANAALKLTDAKFNPGQQETYEIQSPLERIRRLNEAAPLIEAFNDTVKGAPRDIKGAIVTGAVQGIALDTFRIAPTVATEFWRQVAFGDGLSRGDPRLTLRDWLFANRATRMPATHRARYVELAWNAFVEKRKLSKLRVGDLTAPVVLKKPR